MGSNNIISKTSYTNKDFNTIYPELLDLVKKLTLKWDPSISNESDPGVILIKLNALIADKCNYNSDKNVLETFPVSVTQESNARQLYEQLGYYMHWYESAFATIYVSLNNSNTEYTEEDFCEIPPFTTVSDDEGNIIYTLLGTSGSFIPTNGNRVYFDGNSIAFDAIQGIPVKYDINGNTTITSSNLDLYNRIYFTNNDIAQNGIYICNIDTNNYSEWVRKDNLQVENLNNTFYKFGVLPGSEICYLEFPEDAENIFKDGIEIVYIKTLADEGVIPALYIEKFFENTNVQLSDGSTFTLDTENSIVTNFTGSTDGKGKETLSEAYRGYKSVIGTYNTLITLRDYINAALQSGLCSNAFVTDRTNDLQSQYNIVSIVDNVDTPVSIIEEVEDKPVLNAFNLKLYLLQYTSDTIDTPSKYNKTFILETTSEADSFKSYIENQKSISHDYINLLTPSSTQSHFCLFKNKYPLTIRVIPRHNLSYTEAEVISENIRKAIYENFNSKLVDFGAGVDIDDIRDVVLNSDLRISDVSIYNIEYETYVMYWNGEKFKEVSLSSEDSVLIDTSNSSYISSVIPVDGFAIKKSTSTYDSSSIYYKDYLVEYDGDYYICNDNGITGTWESGYWDLIEDYVPSALYDIGQPVFYKDYLYKLLADDADPLTGGSTGMPYFVPEHWTKITSHFVNDYTWQYFNFRYVNGDWQVKYSAEGEYVSLSDNITNYFSYEGSLTDGDVIILEINPANQFKNEIYVKSILGGKTPLFIEDTTFDYDINHGPNGDNLESPIQEIEKIRANVNINFTNINNTYGLRENESLQFFAPSLLDSTTYSNYTKYDYNIASDIQAGTNYELRQGEYIGLYWKDSEKDDAIYQYYIYGEGNIICPSFTMTAGTPVEDNLGNAPTTILWNRKVNISKDGGIQYIASSNKTEDMSSDLSIILENYLNKYLSGSKRIIAKSINQVKVSEGMRIFWVLNSEINNTFVLFDDGSSINEYNPSSTYNAGDFAAHIEDGAAQIWECIANSTTGAWNPEKWTLSEYSQRILNSGEYVFYMDNDLTVFNILGSGTRIIRANDYSKWSVDVVSLEDINNYGATSLINNWFYPPTGSEIMLQEQQFYNIGNGSTVKLINNDDETFDITFNSDTVRDLSNYSIYYAPTLSPGDNDYIQLPGIDTSDSNKGNWSCRSSLFIDSGPGKEQILLNNQSIAVFEKSSNIPTIVSGSDYITENPSNYPVVIQFSLPINTQSMSGDIYITSIDSAGNTIYNDLYLYSKYTNTDSVKYSTFGGASIYFNPTVGVSQQVSFTFEAPEVDEYSGYLLPLYNPYTEDTMSLTVTLNGVTVTDFASGNSQFKNSGTYYLNLGRLNSSPSTILITGQFNSNEKKVFSLSHLYKYSISKNILDEDKYSIYDYLIKNIFDKNHIYNYTYNVPSENLIEDPLSPESFFNTNHIFNKFTIPQADLSNFIITVPSR